MVQYEPKLTGITTTPSDPNPMRASIKLEQLNKHGKHENVCVSLHQVCDTGLIARQLDTVGTNSKTRRKPRSSQPVAIIILFRRNTPGKEQCHMP